MILSIWLILLYITGLWAVIDMILSGVLPILDYKVYRHHSKKSLFIPPILAFLIFIMPFIFHLTNWATILSVALGKVSKLYIEICYIIKTTVSNLLEKIKSVSSKFKRKDKVKLSQ